MITDEHGDKITPTVKAKDILMDHVSLGMSYWSEKGGSEGMTPTEIEKINTQLKKVADRIARMCGYDEAWYS